MKQVIDPKESFRKSPVGKIWAELVTKDDFRTGVATALAQFVFEQDTDSESWESATRDALKLQGARRFLTILLNLAEKEVVAPIKMASDNLNEH